MDFYKIYHKCYMAEKNSPTPTAKDAGWEAEAHRAAINARYKKKLFHKCMGYSILNSGLPLVVNALAMELIYKTTECNAFHSAYVISLLGGAAMCMYSNTRFGGVFNSEIKTCKKEMCNSNHHDIFWECEMDDFVQSANQKEP